MAYNPSSVEELDHVTLTLPYSTFTVQVMDQVTKTFQIVLSAQQDIDTFCSDNPSGVFECEIFIYRSIPPLSYETFLITFNNAPAFDTKTQGSGFDIRSEFRSSQSYFTTPNSVTPSTPPSPSPS